jgi:hypothetical protein
VIVELSLKVLPAPPAWGTVRADAGGLEAALDAAARLGAAGLDLEALDLEPPGRLWIRLGGPAEGLERRLARAEGALGLVAERLLGAEEEAPWSAAREFSWAPAGTHLAKLATTPGGIPELEAALAPTGAGRRYGAAGHLCWVAWPGARPASALDSIARELDVTGVRLTGPPGAPLLGAVGGGAFAARARRGLDPAGALAPFEGSG